MGPEAAKAECTWTEALQEALEEMTPAAHARHRRLLTCSPAMPPPMQAGFALRTQLCS